MIEAEEGEGGGEGEERVDMEIQVQLQLEEDWAEERSIVGKRSRVIEDEMSNARKSAKGRVADEMSDLENDESCSICFEPWTSSGVHRICSLRCGHAFGKHCIETWLSNGARSKCPQCNAPASRKDIRILFVRRLVAVDTSERDALVRQLEEERLARKRTLENEARLQLAYNAAMTRIGQLEEQLIEMRQKAASNGVESGADRIRLEEIRYVDAVNFDASSTSRTMDFDPTAKMFAVAMSKSDGGGSGRHGIGKVSLLDKISTEFFPLHDQLIRAIACSPFADGLVLSASFDKTLKLSSLGTNTSLQSYSLPAPGWSCSFDQSDRNLVYAGLGNGHLLAFDLRNTRQSLFDVAPWERTVATSSSILAPAVSPFPSLPLHSLLVLSDRQPRQLVAASMYGPILFQQSGSELAVRPLDATLGLTKEYGNSCGPLVCGRQNHHLFSLSIRSNPGRHIIGRIQDDRWSRLGEIVGDYPQANLVRSAIYNGDGFDLVSLADGPDAIVLKYDVNGVKQSQVRLRGNQIHPTLESHVDMMDGQKLVIGLLYAKRLCIYC